MPGTITQRGKNVWRLQVYAGFDFNGKPMRYTKTFHGTKREANAELANFYNECQLGNIQPGSNVIVNDLMELYHKEYVLLYLKSTSRRSFEGIYKKWIKNSIGKKKANKVQRVDIQKWINNIAQQVSPKTVRNIYSILRSAFNYGIELNIINNNPCNNIKMPRKEHTEAQFYNIDQVKQICSSLDELPESDLVFKCAILLALFGGLRIGEINGLDWDVIDFDANTIQIVKTRMYEPKTGLYEDTPKTISGNRTVTLPEDIMLQLQFLQKHQNTVNPYFKNNAVFKTDDGIIMHSNVIRNWFMKFCQNNDLPYYGLHALRHTHASMLASLGAELPQVSTRLGHSTLSTTLNIYTHLFENKDKMLSQQLQEFIKNE